MIKRLSVLFVLILPVLCLPILSQAEWVIPATQTATYAPQSTEVLLYTDVGNSYIISICGSFNSVLAGSSLDVVYSTAGWIADVGYQIGKKSGEIEADIGHTSLTNIQIKTTSTDMQKSTLLSFTATNFAVSHSAFVTSSLNANYFLRCDNDASSLLNSYSRTEELKNVWKVTNFHIRC